MTLPASFWPTERKTLASILLPRLEHIAYTAGQHAAQKMNIGFRLRLKISAARGHELQEGAAGAIFADAARDGGLQFLGRNA